MDRFVTRENIERYSKLENPFEPLPKCWSDPLRCRVLSRGGGNETALQSRWRTG